MASITIKVFGGSPPCAKCKNVEKGLKDAVKELGVDAEVVALSALSDEANKYNIMITPAVVINERVVLKGRSPPKDELKHIIQRELEKLSLG